MEHAYTQCQKRIKYSESSKVNFLNFFSDSLKYLKKQINELSYFFPFKAE